MRDEILLAMQQMIAAITGGTVVIGSLPPLEGYAVSLTGGVPRATFWPLTSDQDAIETTAAPALIGREQNINYIYGSAFRVKFYAR